MKYILLLSGLFLLMCSDPGEKLEGQTTKVAVKGVWLTNVASDALLSRDLVKEAVKKCSDLGFNTIYVVTWNKNRTMYPSNVVENITGEKIDPVYGERDPLQEVIEEAHALDMKVIAWFEFGFASANGDETGGLLIQQNSEWASRDIKGNITEKNNFYWLNPFHPKVQQFITDMIVEVVENYDIDGIQGDDRLPALPSNGGYDSLTTSLYKSEHSGALPPEDYLDEGWVQWRADKLTDFLTSLTKEIRSVDEDVIISMAPSIYPWSKNNYLQDWPEWLERGLVDEIIPQIYRYNFTAYRRELDKILEGHVSEEDFTKLKSGILLKVNDFIASESLLDSIYNYNREKNLEGEVYFFYEGIKAREDFFKRVYSQ